MKETFICIEDETGKVVAQGKTKTEPELIARYLKKFEVEIYPNNFKSWFWATRKLSEFADLKWPNIRNMRSLKIGKLRCFGAAENPTFEVVWV